MQTFKTYPGNSPNLFYQKVLCPRFYQSFEFLLITFLGGLYLLIIAIKPSLWLIFSFMIILPIALNLFRLIKKKESLLSKNSEEVLFNSAKSIFLEINNKDYLNQFFDLHLKREYRKAISIISKLIDLFPEQPIFYGLRANCYQYLGDEEKTYIDLQMATKKGPGETYYQYLLFNANLYFEKYENAKQILLDILIYGVNFNEITRKEFEQLSKDFPKYVEKRLQLNKKLEKFEEYLRAGWMNLEFKEYDKAIENFSHAKKINYENAASYFGIGSVYQTQHLYSKATQQYEIAIEWDPNNNDILYSLGYSFFGQNDFKAALNVLKKHTDSNSLYGKFNKKDFEKLIAISENILKGRKKQ